LTINGKTYDESAANLRLLAQLIPSLANSGLYPNDPYKRHAISAILDFNGTTYRPLSSARNKCFLTQYSKKGAIDDELKQRIVDGNEK